MGEHAVQITGLWITGIGVVVGIGVLVVYIGQLKAMRGQLTEMNTQTAQIIKSVAAVERQGNLMERQMRLSLHAHLAMRNWTTQVEMGAMLPTRVHVRCDIANTGNIPATVGIIETRREWNAFVTDVAANATIYPGDEPYPFYETIECADLAFRGTDRAGGSLRGTVRYRHAFERRIKNFYMLVWVNTAGESGIERMEGPGNNDEPDQNPN